MAAWKNVRVNEYDLRTKSMRLSVHRHRDFPGEWYLTCYELQVTKRLGDVTLDTAKIKALNIIYAKLQGMVSEIQHSKEFDKAFAASNKLGDLK